VQQLRYGERLASLGRQWEKKGNPYLKPKLGPMEQPLAKLQCRMEDDEEDDEEDDNTGLNGEEEMNIDMDN